MGLFLVFAIGWVGGAQRVLPDRIKCQEKVTKSVQMTVDFTNKWILVRKYANGGVFCNALKVNDLSNRGGF